MSPAATTKTDLLLLGLLLDRPMHGYELYQQIQAECIDGWLPVSAAGVYYSLRKLRDQGLMAETRRRVGRSQVDLPPDREGKSCLFREHGSGTCQPQRDLPGP